MSSDNLVQSVERALLILETLAESQKGFGITTISKKTNLNKATVHRLLGTLMSKGFVKKNIDNDNYCLGLKILLLSSSMLEDMDLINIAKPYIKKLSNTTGEVVHLSILDNNEVVYIDKVESDHPKTSIRMSSKIGKRAPIYCTAAGKVLLSQLKDQEIISIFDSAEKTRHTESTIMEAEDYIKEIETVRTSGYAIDDMEYEDGVRCICAPIKDRSGKIIAAMSLSGFSIYYSKEDMLKINEDLVSTAKTISEQLGFVKI